MDNGIKDLTDKKSKVTNNDTGRFFYILKRIFDLFKTGYIICGMMLIKTQKDTWFSWTVADKAFGSLSDMKFIDTHSDRITDFMQKKRHNR